MENYRKKNIEKQQEQILKTRLKDKDNNFLITFDPHSSKAYRGIEKRGGHNLLWHMICVQHAANNYNL